MKIAGIKPLSQKEDDKLLNELKQGALLFDKIGIPLLDVFLQKMPNSYLKSELDLLKDNQFLFDAWQGPVKLSKGVDMKEIQAELDFMTDLRKSGADADLMFEASARQCAIILNNQFDKPDYFCVPLLKKLGLSSQENIRKGDVAQIVIEKIPIPKENTPWEKIWDFKNDSDNIGKMSGIRTWINSVVKTSLTTSEISDELEYKLYQYRTSLELHKIEYESGLLKSFIVGGAETLENIARLKFSDIAKGLFRHNRKRSTYSKLN
jgi:hypothetical protein